MKHLTGALSDDAVFYSSDLMIFIQILCLLQTEGMVCGVDFFKKKESL